MSAALFPIGDDSVAVTTDDWYTPAWIFKAAGIRFDMDVAAPVDPVFRTCPADRYLTAADDGLTAPWSGVVWMNPPYSRATPWVDRFADHDDGLALLPAIHESVWLGKLLRAADAVALLSPKFGRPDGSTNRPFSSVVLAGRGGICIPAVARVAAADRYAGGAYHVAPDLRGTA